MNKVNLDNFTLKYGSYSAMIYHLIYTIDEELPFLAEKTKHKLRTRIQDIIEKFMEDNNLHKHLDKRKP